MRRHARKLRYVAAVVAAVGAATIAAPGTAFATVSVSGACTDNDVRILSLDWTVGHCYRYAGELWPGLERINDMYFGSYSGDYTLCTYDHKYCELYFFNPGSTTHFYVNKVELHRIKLY